MTNIAAIKTTDINRSDAVPLYHQIFLTLRDEIMSGHRAFGTSVPTEHELGEIYGVSRVTARRALDELAQHHLVERRRRTGTRVIFRNPIGPIEANIDQAVESLIAFGSNTSVKVTDISHQPASARIAEVLEIEPNDIVIRAVRLRFMDDEPLGQVTSYVPAHLQHLITPGNLTDKPMLSLLRTDGHAIGGGQQTIAALVADPALAIALGVENRAPVLQVERVVTDNKRKPLLFTTALYRADRYRINLDLHGA